MGSPMPIGRVQPLFRGAWQSNIEYTKLDNVFYENSTYFSLSDENLNHTPSSDSSYWGLGCVGAPGVEGPPGPLPTLFAPSCYVTTISSTASASASISVVEGSGADSGKVGYQFELWIPRGHDGAGAVSSVDNIPSDSGNVQLDALSYGRAQSLSSAQRTQVCENIGAISSSEIDNIISA